MKQLTAVIVVPVALFMLYQLGMGLVHVFHQIATALPTVPPT